jgi:putative flippase GtrA
VALVKDAYSRIEHLVREVAKFGIVGGVNYVVTVLVDLAYLQIERNGHLTAYILGNVVATVVAYVGSRFWTYRDREGGGVREMVLFATINALAIVMQAGIVAVTFYVLHMTSKVENFLSEFVLAIGLGMAFRFFCYRTFIFPKAEPVPAADADGVQYREAAPATASGRIRPSESAASDSSTTGTLLSGKKR